eukprot:GILJ01026212.1.p1 GENE.GILJ01026212.1~~GILJ01026212.1.p1  ORF type:complete len:119 (-),score=0.93 GILJ01026212.1:23-379(-)
MQETRNQSIRGLSGRFFDRVDQVLNHTPCEEGKWNYDHMLVMVVLRLYSEVEIFHLCTCRMNDRNKPMVKTRDCFVRHMADLYEGKSIENRRSKKSSKTSKKTYTPRSRASQQAQFAK